MSAPAEDERLALAAQGGDASAAEALLEKYKNMVRGIARRFSSPAATRKTSCRKG